MSGDQTKWRLFIAAYPPQRIAQRYINAMIDLGLGPYRTTPLAQVHLTLHFIGPADPRELDTITESIERSCAGLGAFELTPERFVTMPRRGRPRLVALALTANPALSELHTRLVHRLARNPGDHPGRGYTPHLTLCRFTRSARPADLDQPAKLPGFPVTSIRLMRSILRSEGPEHRKIFECKL